MMQNSSVVAYTRPDQGASRRVLAGRKKLGRSLVALASLGALVLLLIQILHATGTIAAGFTTWRPILYAYLVWAIVLGVGQVVIRGESGLRALFLLPAVLYTIAVVIFP
ncbi:MAG: sugar ABC transporter permease, partial [Bradyrhizobium sp.]